MKELWTRGVLSLEQMAHLLCRQTRLKCLPPPVPFLLSGTVTAPPPREVTKAPAEGLSITQSPEAIKEKGDKSKSIKIQIFCIAKTTMCEDKRKMTNKGKLLATCTADRGLIFLIYNEMLQINKKKWAKATSRQEI